MENLDPSPQCESNLKALKSSKESASLEAAHKLMIEINRSLALGLKSSGVTPSELALDVLDLHRGQDALEAKEAEHLRSLLLGLNEKLKVLDLSLEQISGLRSSYKQSISSRESVQDFVKGSQSEQERLRQELENQIRKLTDQKNKAIEENIQLSKALREKSNENESLQNKCQLLDTELSQLKLEERNFIKAQETIKDLQLQVKNHEEMRGNLKEKFEQAMQDHQSHSQELQSEIANLTQSNADLHSELKTANQSISELNDLKNQHISQIEQSNSHIESLKSELLVLEDSKAKAQQMSELAESYQQEIARLSQEFENTSKTFERLRDELDTAKEEAHDTIRKTYSDLKRIEQEARDAQAQLEEIQLKDEQLGNQLAATEEKLFAQEDSLNIIDQINKMQQEKETFIQAFYKEMDFISDFLVTQSEQNLTHQRISGKLKDITRDKNTEINIVRDMITELRKYQAYQPIKDDIIDEALAEFIANRTKPLDVPFIREDEGIYLFGSKRIFMKLEGSKVIIRIGGGFMHIDQFVDVYTPLEIERLDTKKKTADNPARKNAIGKLASSMVGDKTGKIPSILKGALGGGTSKYSPMLAVPKKPEADKRRRASQF